MFLPQTRSMLMSPEWSQPHIRAPRGVPTPCLCPQSHLHACLCPQGCPIPMSLSPGLPHPHIPASGVAPSPMPPFPGQSELCHPHSNACAPSVIPILHTCVPRGFQPTALAPKIVLIPIPMSVSSKWSPYPPCPCPQVGPMPMHIPRRVPASRPWHCPHPVLHPWLCPPSVHLSPILPRWQRQL